MQAAITLRDRGHNVNLYEKSELGGQFNQAWLPPNKQNLKKCILLRLLLLRGRLILTV